jgi:hypothetical protein
VGDQEDEEKPMQSALAAPQEDLVALGTKVRASTRKRLRRFSVDEEVEMQDVIDQAIDAYLRDRGY